VITSFTYAWQPDGTVRLQGHAADEEPGMQRIDISGVASGVTYTDARGNFDVTLRPSQPGVVRATATDQWLQTALAAAVSLTNAPPVIVNFTGGVVSGTLWTFTGTVKDESPQGLTVYFSGLPDLNGKTATVGADGSFSLTVQLTYGQGGTVQAQVTD